MNLLALTILVIIPGVFGSHFRGGLITWKPAGPNQIEISYRVAFRRSSGNHACDDGNFQNSSLVAGEGNLECLYGCQGVISNMSYYCTDYSETEDWTTGIRSVTYTLPQSTTNIFHFGYTSCCWIPLAEGYGHGWIMRTTADLNIRKDTGKINSSPITGMQPIIRFSQGCDYKLKIPVVDDDGDIVRCRWARKLPFDECDSVCSTFSGAVLNEKTCVLTYNATGPTGWYAVALQIEDFKSSTDTEPLSSVSLQFMVKVSNSSESCTSKPVFPNNEITDGSVKLVKAYQNVNITISAQSGSETSSITEIQTLSPQGMTKSDLYKKPDEEEWFVYVLWEPTSQQAGSHVFCYSATDNTGQTSDQVCSTLVVQANETNDKTTVAPNGETTVAAVTTELQSDEGMGVVMLNAANTNTIIPNEIKRICSKPNLQQFYYPTSSPAHFLQCNAYGGGFIMPCAPGTVWCQPYVKCVSKKACPSN